MNIKDIIGAINELVDIIYKYHIEGVNLQLEYLGNLRSVLVGDVILSERKKITMYHSLFPPNGGLSEINYWNNDFEVRKQVSEVVSWLASKVKKQSALILRADCFFNLSVVQYQGR